MPNLILAEGLDEEMKTIFSSGCDFVEKPGATAVLAFFEIAGLAVAESCLTVVFCCEFVKSAPRVYVSEELVGCCVVVDGCCGESLV